LIFGLRRNIQSQFVKNVTEQKTVDQPGKKGKQQVALPEAYAAKACRFESGENRISAKEEEHS